MGLILLGECPVILPAVECYLLAEQANKAPQSNAQEHVICLRSKQIKHYMIGRSPIISPGAMPRSKLFAQQITGVRAVIWAYSPYNCYM